MERPAVLGCVPSFVAEYATKVFGRREIARLCALFVRADSSITTIVRVGLALCVMLVLGMVPPTSIICLAMSSVAMKIW